MGVTGVAEHGPLAGSIGVAVGAVVGAGAAMLILRRRRKGEGAIREKLRAAGAVMEVDLAQLRIDDADEQMSEAWNQLIGMVAEARRELEVVQVRQQAHDTLDRYRLTWVTELLDKLPEGLLTVTEELNVSFANTKATQLLARGREELVGQKITDLFDASLSCVRPSTGAMLDRTFELTSPQVSLHLTSTAWGRQGSSGETAVFLRDVSHVKAQERARNEFFYHVTHELRTPLTNIRAYAETLSEGVFEDPDTLRECYNVIVGETQRLSRLVEDILSLSQLEVGSARLAVDEVQTARLIRQVVEDMQASADEKGLELVLSLPAKVPTIRGEKERLAVVLTNLVGNAIKYTPSGGRVEVSCAEDGARLRIAVSDSGIGIAPEDCEKIFDKFYRADREDVAKVPGTGLGLAITRETVRAHGGTIEVQSELDQGSTFTVVLPIGKTAAIGSWESK